MRRPELAAWVLAAALVCGAVFAQSTPQGQPAGAEDGKSAPQFPGMDQAVNVGLAEQAGVHARKPYIDVESLGDLWNLILLSGGAISGFIVGRYWNQIWGRPK